MTAVQFELQSLAWMGEGWRPRTLDASDVDGSVVYAGIWEPYDNADPEQRFTFDLDMTPSELQAMHDDVAPQGYHPVSVAGYEVSGSPHFAVIWHYDPTVAYYWRAQLDSAEYQEVFDMMAEKNVCVDARRDRIASDVLERIAGRPGGNGLQNRIEHQERVARRHGGDLPGRLPRSKPTPGCRFKLMDVDGYLDGGTVMYIAVWVLEKGGYGARHGMSFKQLVYDPVGSKLEMVKVAAYPVGGREPAYAAVWHVMTDELRYAFPKLPGGAYQDLFDLKGGQGYTLMDIAIEEGARRTGPLYTSLWKAPVGRADQVELHWPLSGVPGVDWTLVNYQDHIAGSGMSIDYMGNQWLYDDHNGIDIALRNFEEMDAGIDVIAAEDGVVKGVVDGNFDKNTCGISGCTGCDPNGNTVFVEHANGQRTWYMHLKKGSIIVSDEQKVVRGQKLAEVGSSGNSSDAHLHFAVIDPPYSLGVSGGDLREPWEGPFGNSQNLWSVVPPYEPTVLNVMDADVTDHNPTRCEFTAREDHVGLFVGPYSPSERVYVWLQIGGTVSPTEDLTIELHQPDGTLQDTIDVADGSYQYGFFAWWYGLASLSAIDTGAWRFDVVRNGVVEITTSFVVAP